MRARRALALLGALTLLAVSFAFVTAPARAGVAELPSIEGCYDTVAGAVGLFGGEQTPSSGIDLEVPGQVAYAVVEWVGQDPAASGVSSLDLALSGPDGAATGSFPGTLSAADSALGKPLFAWYADVTTLFGVGAPGSYTVDVTPFAVPGAGFAWGATLTVVYDTSPCEQESLLSWKVGTNYYFGGAGGGAAPSRTDVMVYEFGPSAVDRVAAIRASHGGADSDAPGCRVSAFWAATGSGTPPGPGDDLVDATGNPVFAGATEVAVAPFSPAAQGCPAPVPSLPLLSITGGNVGPEYALVEMEFLIPAGVEWVALQLESPGDNGGFSGIPESGAWAGGGAFLLTEAEPAPVAGIVLEKTVLAGSGVCPGVEGSDELVVGDVGAPVTYCYRVVNSGESALLPVTVDDPSLGITDADMTVVSGDPGVPLAPGDVVVLSFETAIDGPLTGVAVTEGIPVEADGTPIEGLDPVTDSNDAGVDVPGIGEVPVAGIVLEKTVLAGSGVCPGVEGSDELVVGDVGASVTYCYRVVNSGESALLPVTVDDPSLGITDGDMTVVSGDLGVPLALGDVVVLSFETAIDGPLTGVAVTEGIPVEADGTPIEGLDPVTDSNDAGVDVPGIGEVPVAGIVLEKTVLAGSGVCPGVEGTDELFRGVVNAPARFCYRIINTGDTALFPVTLDDPDLGVTEADLIVETGTLISPLMPGDEIVASLPVVGVVGVSEASVSGVPSSDGGVALGFDPVVSSNDAGIEVLAASFVLEKTVLEGHGASCAGVESSDELVTGLTGTPVTFCFRVVNTGTTHLFPVGLVDVTLGITDADMSVVAGDPAVPLAPGAEIVWAYDHVLVASVVNVATATAVPSGPEGGAVSGEVLVSSNDARLAILQETLPRTGSSLFEQLRLGLTLLMAGAFVVAAGGIINGSLEP